MFYGDFSGENGKIFTQILEHLNKIFAQAVFASDNLITLGKNHSFFADEKFKQAFFRHAEDDQEKSLAWRLHVLCWAARNSLKVEGDFVECGVYKGFSFKVITEYLDFTKQNKSLYLYDTFAGIPKGYNDAGYENIKYKSDADLFDKVKNSFAAYPNVKVIKGIIPDVFKPAVMPQKIAFLHIDLNSAKSELAALEHLYDRVSENGIIVFDDFGWISSAKQAREEIEFMKSRDQQILELPTGQGMLIKRKQKHNISSNLF